MTELEIQVISKLVSDNTIKFYIRYVDDTLVLIKMAQNCLDLLVFSIAFQLK